MAANYEIFFWSIRKQGSQHEREVYAGYRALCVEALQRATRSALPATTATSMAQFLMNATDGVIIEYLSERDETAALAHLDTPSPETAIARFAPPGVPL